MHRENSFKSQVSLLDSYLCVSVRPEVAITEPVVDDLCTVVRTALPRGALSIRFLKAALQK